jgi:outer membrane protein
MNRLPLILSAVIIAAGLTSCKSKADKPATEEPKAGPQQGSIVYFNLDRVVKEYDMANDLRSVVNTKVSGINQEVNRRGSKLQQDINSFQDKVNKGLLTQSTAQVQNSQLQEQQSNFQTYAQQKQQEILDEQQVMTNQIADAIKKYVDKLNAEKKYSMILATQGDVLPMPVVAADTTLDITSEILEGLNAEYVAQKGQKEKTK